MEDDAVKALVRAAVKAATDAQKNRIIQYLRRTGKVFMDSKKPHHVHAAVALMNASVMIQRGHIGGGK